MRVFKNLFGNGSKIAASEIVVGNNSLLSQAVIVDCGESANSIYLKFGNGIMICAISKEYEDTPVKVSFGSLYVSSTIVAPNYPQPFIDIPFVSESITNSNSASFLGATSGNPSVTKPKDFWVGRGTPAEKMKVRYSCIAIGRWK